MDDEDKEEHEDEDEEDTDKESVEAGGVPDFKSVLLVSTNGGSVRSVVVVRGSATVGFKRFNTGDGSDGAIPALRFPQTTATVTFVSAISNGDFFERDSPEW